MTNPSKNTPLKIPIIENSDELKQLNKDSESGGSQRGLEEAPTLKHYTEETVTVDKSRMPHQEEVVPIANLKPLDIPAQPSPTSETRNNDFENKLTNKYSSMEPQTGIKSQMAMAK